MNSFLIIFWLLPSATWLRQGNVFTPVILFREVSCRRPPGRHPQRRPLQQTVRILLECILVFNISSHSVVGQYSTRRGFPENQAVTYFDHYHCCFSHSLMQNDMKEKKIGCDLSKVNCLMKFSSKHAMRELNRLWIITQSWSPKCRIHCCDLKVRFKWCNCSRATSN